MSLGRIGLAFLAIFLVFALFFTSISSFVSAQQTVGGQISDAVTNFFKGSSADFADALWFKKFLLFGLVGLILYSVGSFLPFVGEKPWANGGIAIIVALLATLYLNADEVGTILFSYNALGVALTSLIPFFAIAAISKKSYELSHTFFSKVLWVAFIVVLIVRWLAYVPVSSSTFGAWWLYPISLIGAVLMLLFERWIWFGAFGLAIRGDFSKVKRLHVAKLEAELAQLQDRIGSMSSTDAGYNELQVRIKDLKGRIRKETRLIG